jgi:predicted nucleic acid-binding protein
MDVRAIVDTGYLVALLNADDEHHSWAASLLPRLRGPWLTAEACISEAVFLLEQAGRLAAERLFEWLDKGAW